MVVMVQLGNVQVFAVKNAEVDEGLWSFIGFLHVVSGFGGAAKPETRVNPQPLQTPKCVLYCCVARHA